MYNSNRYVLYDNLDYYVDIKTRKRSGLYFIKGLNNELLYVGKSKNLMKRVNPSTHHIIQSYIDVISKINIVFIDDIEKMNFYENYLIYKLRPLLNHYGKKEHEDKYKRLDNR